MFTILQVFIETHSDISRTEGYQMHDACFRIRVRKAVASVIAAIILLCRETCEDILKEMRRIVYMVSPFL